MGVAGPSSRGGVCSNGNCDGCECSNMVDAEAIDASDCSDSDFVSESSDSDPESHGGGNAADSLGRYSQMGGGLGADGNEENAADHSEGRSSRCRIAVPPVASGHAVVYGLDD